MKKRNFSSALRITLIYLAIGGMWIIFSDKFLVLLTDEPNDISSMQTYKGWFYVGITSLLLYYFLKKNADLEEKTRSKAEADYRMLVERLPGVVFMDNFNNPQTSHYMSPRLTDLLGYTPEEWVASKDMWESSLHPDDRQRVLAEDVRTNNTEDSFRIEYRMRHRDGHYVWIKEVASIVKDTDGKPQFWQGIMMDITEQKMAEEALIRRDAIIKAVGFSAEQFLKSVNWEENVDKVLEQLGQAVQVSRVYLFKKEPGKSQESTISQTHEWCDEGIMSQIRNRELQDMGLPTACFSRWQEQFTLGQPIHGCINEFPIEEREVFQKQGVLSLVCIPIMLGNDWWGFIGFDDCRSERVWTDVEIGALQAAASALGTTIQRYQHLEALSKSESSYRGLFNSTQDAIYIQDTQGFFLDVNDGALKMYGHPREFFVGKTPEILSAPGKNDLEKAATAVKAAFEGKPQEFEFWGIRSDGEVFPKDVRLFKGTYFGRDVVIAIAQDITARKQYEDALQKQLRELTVLHSVALTESTAKTTDELIHRITDIISDSLYSDNCGVFIFDEGKETLSPHYSYRGIDVEEMSSSLHISRGICGRAVTSRRSVRVGDVTADPSYVKISSRARSELSVPIITGSKIFGVLNVESNMPDAFTEKDERLLNTISGGLANAIERIQLYESEKLRLQQAEILGEATLELTSFFELDNLFEKIFSLLEKLIVFESASVELLEQGTSQIVAGKNIPVEMIGTKYETSPEKWGGMDTLRNPVIIPDIREDERFHTFKETNYIRSWMGIPLLAQDKLIGFLNLDSAIPGFFNNEHARFVQILANQAAIAIENARLFKNEQQRRRDAENLGLATTSLANSLNFEDLFEKILDWLEQLAPYDSASIMLRQDKSVHLAACRNLPSDFRVGQEFPMTEKWNLIEKTRKPLIIEDAQKETLFEKWAGSEYIHGWMAIAMFTQDKLIGFINLDSFTPGAFSDVHADLFQTFANQAATVIENVRLYTETRQRLEELEMVSRVSYALRIAQDTQEMLPILLNEIKSSIETYEAALWLLDADTNLLTPRITSGKMSALPKSIFKPGEGIVGKVYLSGESGLSADFHKDPAASPENAQFIGEGWASFAVPIRTSSEIIGVLAVGQELPRKFESHQQRLITTIAEIAGNAIHRSNLYERSEEQIRRLTTLREMDTAISSSLDLHITLKIITEHLVTKMGASAASILVYNPNSQMLDLYASQGFHNTESIRASLSIGDGFIGQLLLSRQPVYVMDLNEDTHSHTNLLLSNENFVSYYAVPLFSKGAARGILETYFREPFNPSADWVEFIHTLAGQATIAIDNTQLFENLQRTNQELSLAYDTTLEGWGKALELRDKETQGHTRRVTNLTVELARQMGIPKTELAHIRRGSLLHDIGKMGVPDSILHKPGPLTEEEKTEMRKHPQYAFDLLSPISYLRPTLDIAYCHHEWWDGTGYPRGLKGEDIPLSARIFAVVDVWDALLSDRPYRRAWKEKDVMDYINGLSGKQFDPHVLDTFKALLEANPKFIKSNLPENKPADTGDKGKQPNAKNKKKR